MPAFAIFGLDWLHLAVYGEAGLIILLLLFVRALWRECYRLDDRAKAVKRERDEAKDTLALIRRMSEIRVETVTRMRGFSQ